jgi:hypothetical protein
MLQREQQEQREREGSQAVPVRPSCRGTFGRGEKPHEMKQIMGEEAIFIVSRSKNYEMQRGI